MYHPVPPELQAESERELDGKTETFIDMQQSSPLSNWAAKKREEKRKKKAKRKAAKASKRKNRK